MVFMHRQTESDTIHVCGSCSLSRAISAIATRREGIETLNACVRLSLVPCPRSLSLILILQLSKGSYTNKGLTREWIAAAE